jgi:hypothetical protein
MGQLHAALPYFFKTHFNIILPYKLSHPNGVTLSGYSTISLYAFFFSRICATCPASLVFLHLSTLIIFDRDPRERDHLEDLDVDGIIILKWIFKK